MCLALLSLSHHSATFPSGIEFSGLSRCPHCPEMVYGARFSAGSGRAVGIAGIWETQMSAGSSQQKEVIFVSTVLAALRPGSNPGSASQ